MRKLFIMLAMVAVLLLACQKTTVQTSVSDPVKEFKIKMTHSVGYSPNAFEVDKGDTVRFLATSDPVSHRHGIAIDEFKVNVEITKSSAQEPQVIEFVADKAGTFKIHCKSCDEGPLGSHPWMEGKLIVK